MLKSGLMAVLALFFYVAAIRSKSRQCYFTQ